MAKRTKKKAEKTPTSDDQLMADLEEISAEVKRRSKAKVPQAYAEWALYARMAVLARFHQRHGLPSFALFSDIDSSQLAHSSTEQVDEGTSSKPPLVEKTAESISSELRHAEPSTNKRRVKGRH